MSRAIIPLIFTGLIACTPQVDDDDGFGMVSSQRGADLYSTHCVACHGENATGNGPASLGLAITPPNLTTLSARAGGTFPDDYVLLVLDGKDRAADPDAAMPEFGASDLGRLEMIEHDMLNEPVPTDLFSVLEFLKSIQVEK